VAVNTPLTIVPEPSVVSGKTAPPLVAETWNELVEEFATKYSVFVEIPVVEVIAEKNIGSPFSIPCAV
jgi:ubiquinone biosynthesis protein Coq4